MITIHGVSSGKESPRTLEVDAHENGILLRILIPTGTRQKTEIVISRDGILPLIERGGLLTGTSPTGQTSKTCEIKWTPEGLELTISTESGQSGMWITVPHGSLADAVAAIG